MNSTWKMCLAKSLVLWMLWSCDATEKPRKFVEIVGLEQEQNGEREEILLPELMDSLAKAVEEGFQPDSSQSLRKNLTDQVLGGLLEGAVDLAKSYQTIYQLNPGQEGTLTVMLNNVTIAKNRITWRQTADSLHLRLDAQTAKSFVRQNGQWVRKTRNGNIIQVVYLKPIDIQ